MSTVRSFFLRAKHWQIFPVLVAILLVLHFIRSPYVAKGGWVPLLLPSRSYGSAILYTVTFSLCMFWVVGWLWSMGYFLSDLRLRGLSPSKRFLEITCLYAVIYVPVSVTFFSNIEPGVGSITYWLGVLYISCMFYVVYFVSRRLVLAEGGESISTYKYVWTFFLLWSFPIGVWIVQPKINRLFAGNVTSQSPAGAELV